ncbi:hypothetical protein XENOCAPTIV_016067 [Xenoophorus captivus]|uniref:Uncharacterized protein n=1 Tax=Xenoophorus captivus TaxID=1517983 RepID=A0ABV0SFL2_9TELE
MITIELNLCTAQWAGFNSSSLALNGNHINPACLGSVDESVNPPILRPFSSFSNIQSVIITSYIDTPKSDVGIISYSTDLYYYFSCRYPLEYLINNTQIVAQYCNISECWCGCDQPGGVAHVWIGCCPAARHGGWFVLK